MQPPSAVTCETKHCNNFKII